MTVCFFGNYIREYPRIQVMKKGLAQQGVVIIECHTRERGWHKYYSLLRQHRRIQGKYDVLLVCMGGQTLTWFARMISRKPMVYDAFVSLFVTNVHDRALCQPMSVKGRFYRFIDTFACRFAHCVLIDTQAQLEYFINALGVPREKLRRVLIGADDGMYMPDSSLVEIPDEQTGNFVVSWHGYIVPFHGLDTVLKAAKLLETYPDISFRITTRFDSKYDHMFKLSERLQLSNVIFLPERDAVSIARELQAADVMLGVFGNNVKAHLVIPNKIYEAAACETAVITGRQPAIEEVFKDRESILLCEPENPKDLTEKILALKHDSVLRQRIARGGYEIYLRVGTPKVIGKQLFDLCSILKEHGRPILST